VDAFLKDEDPSSGGLLLHRIELLNGNVVWLCDYHKFYFERYHSHSSSWTNQHQTVINQHIHGSGMAVGVAWTVTVTHIVSNDQGETQQDVQ